MKRGIPLYEVDKEGYRVYLGDLPWSEWRKLNQGEPMTERDPLLVERQATHGDFGTNALISQQLKEIIHGSGLRTKPTTATGYHDFHVAHREALDMIALKISRICSGQSNFKDHWDDIAGYAKLASEACDDTSRPA